MDWYEVLMTGNEMKVRSGPVGAGIPADGGVPGFWVGQVNYRHSYKLRLSYSRIIQIGHWVLVNYQRHHQKQPSKQPEGLLSFLPLRLPLGIIGQPQMNQ